LSPTIQRISLAFMRRWMPVATMISMSLTPWSASNSRTMVRTRSRTSGRFIGGRGTEMSSIAIATRMPGLSFAYNGSEPSG
jgi:hypothetical protein